MEGSQTTLIIAKLLMKILEILDRIRREYLERSLRKKEMGLKNKRTLWKDKRQLGLAKNFKQDLSNREVDLKGKVREKKQEIDLYKLNMQAKLEEFNIAVKKAQRAFDIVEKKTEKVMNRDSELAKLQNDINSKLEAKRKFELEVNKSLLKRDNEYKELQDSYNRVIDDIKICNKVIDGFSSEFKRHATEALRTSYEDVIERNTPVESKEVDIDINVPSVEDKHIDVNINNDISDAADKNIDVKTEIDSNNAVLKDYLEQQRRQSLNQQRNKNRDEIER